MNEYDEKAARQKAKAEYITTRVQDTLAQFLREHVNITDEFTKADKKRGRKKKTNEIQLPEQMEKVLQENGMDLADHERKALQQISALIVKYEKRIVAFIREQLTSDDDKFL